MIANFSRIMFGLILFSGFSFASATLYKSEYCGCCEQWQKILSSKGYKFNIKNVEDIDVIKDKLKIRDDMRSCHTLVLDNGKFIEGHVPTAMVMNISASTYSSLISPGMPQNSEGMSNNVGKTKIYTKNGNDYKMIGMY